MNDDIGNHPIYKMSSHSSSLQKSIQLDMGTGTLSLEKYWIPFVKTSPYRNLIVIGGKFHSRLKTKQGPQRSKMATIKMTMTELYSHAFTKSPSRSYFINRDKYVPVSLKLIVKMTSVATLDALYAKVRDPKSKQIKRHLKW